MAKSKIEIEVVQEDDKVEFEEDRLEAERVYAVKFERKADEVSPNGNPMYSVEGEDGNILDFLVNWYGLDEEDAKELYPEIA